jgi:hypothetical protein
MRFSGLGAPGAGCKGTGRRLAVARRQGCPAMGHATDKHAMWSLQAFSSSMVKAFRRRGIVGGDLARLGRSNGHHTDTISTTLTSPISLCCLV